MINYIVFSKDRPCQLHALLASYIFSMNKKPTFNIIYKYSNDRFRVGYDKLKSKKEFDLCTFYNENTQKPNVSFKSITRFCVNKGLVNKQPYTCFLVDDDIFTRPFSEEDIMEFESNKQLLAISLRLGKNINYCYPTNTYINTPSSTTFNWKEYKGDFGYPMSLDGHIFRTDDIEKYVNVAQYFNPNDLEVVMSGNPIDRDYIKMYDKSVLMNVVANRVQDKYKNRVPKDQQTAKQLNDEYIKGKLINIIPFIFYDNNSPHIEERYHLIWGS